MWFAVRSDYLFIGKEKGCQFYAINFVKRLCLTSLRKTSSLILSHPIRYAACILRTLFTDYTLFNKESLMKSLW